MANSLIANPYAKRKFSKEELASIPDMRPAISEVGKGIRAFADESQAAGYGVLALGAQKLKDVFNAQNGGFLDRTVQTGQEGYIRNIEEATYGRQAPNIARVEDIKDISSGFDWAAYNLAKGLPQLGMLATGGGVGAGIAKATVKKKLKDTLKAKVSDTVTKEMKAAAKAEVKKRISRGALAGGFAGGAGLEGGHAMGQALEAGVDPSRAADAAIVIGGINGALEFLPLYGIAKKLGRGDFAKKSIRNIIKNDAELSKRAIALAVAKETSKRAGGAGLVGAGAEGITEGLQELVNIAGLRWAENEPMFADLDPEDWSQVKNAMAAGGLVGMFAGGAAAPFKGPGQVEVTPAGEVVPPVAAEVIPPTPPVEPGTEGKLIGQPVITPMHPKKKQPAGPVTPELEQLPLKGELVNEDTDLATQEEQAQIEAPFIEGRFKDVTGQLRIGEQKKLEETIEIRDPQTEESHQIEAPWVTVLEGNFVMLSGQNIDIPFAITDMKGDLVAEGLTKEEALANLETYKAKQPEDILGELVAEWDATKATNEIDTEFESIDYEDTPLPTRSLTNEVAEFQDPAIAAKIKTIEQLVEDGHLTKESAANQMAGLANQLTGDPVVASVMTAVKTSEMTKSGGQAGSNKGAWFTDDQGMDFYVKEGQTPDHAMSEHIAQQLYALAGIEVPDTTIIKGDSEGFAGSVIASQHVVGGTEALKNGFVIDAWLGNWDVIGLKNDNYLGTPEAGTRIDFGGALHYRAQGGKKGDAGTQSFGSEVGELQTLRDPNINPQAAVVFKNVTNEDIIEQAGVLARLDNEKIYDIVTLSYSEQKADIAQALVDTLLDRKQNILKYAEALKQQGPNKETAGTAEALQHWVKGFDKNAPLTQKLKYAMEDPHKGIWAEIGKEESRYGVLLINPDNGKVLLRKPANDYGMGNDGYAWTFAKGKPISQEHPTAAAIRELQEETGYKTDLVGQLGKPFYSATGTGALFYIGVVKGEQQSFGKETSGLKWATYEEALALVKEGTNKQGIKRDIEILGNLFGIAKPDIISEFPIKKGALHAKSYFQSGQFAEDAPWPPWKYKSWVALTSLRRLYVKSAAYLKQLNKAKNDYVLSEADINKEVKRMQKAFKVWSGFSLMQVIKKIPLPTSETDMLNNFPLKTGVPFVAEVYHGNKSGELVNDLINPIAHAGSGFGGADTTALSDKKGVFYLANTVTGAKAYTHANNINKVFAFYFAAKNPKIFWYDESWISKVFKQEITKASDEGYDSIVFVNTSDTGGKYHQFIAFDAQQQVRTRELENVGYALDEEAKFFESQSAENVTTNPKEKFNHDFTNVFGEGVLAQATKNGLLTINETSPENSPAGLFNKETNQITINLDRVGEGETPMSVLLHEGRHAGMQDVLGETLPLFHQDLLDLANRGNEDAQSSIIRSTGAVADLLGLEHGLYDMGLPQIELEAEVKAIRKLIEEKEQGVGLLQEEDLAYYIQDAANATDLTAPGLYRRLINALKVWWAQSGVGQMFAQAGLRAELTQEMAVELAKAAVRKAVQADPAMQESEGVLASNPIDLDKYRKVKQLNEFKKKLGKDIDERTAEKMQEIADTSYKYKASDIVLSASTGRRITIKGQILIDDFREPLPPFKDYQARRKMIKARPQIPGYVVEYSDGDGKVTTTMAEWGIKNKATGPQVLESVAVSGGVKPQYSISGMKQNGADYTVTGLIKMKSDNEQELYTKGQGENKKIYQISGGVVTVTTASSVQKRMATNGVAIQLSQIDGNLLQSIPNPLGALKRWWGESKDTPLDANNVDLAGKFRAHIIDNLATIDEKSEDVHKVAEVAKSKTSAEQSKINRLYLDPLVKLAVATGLNQKQLDEWLLARGVLLDDENWQNTQKRSWMVARDLALALPKKLQADLDKRRVSLTKDQVWIDKEGETRKIPKIEVLNRMVDLVNEYFQEAEKLSQDGTLGEQFTAWRDLQDSWIKIQAHSAGLYSPGKVDVNGQLLPGQPKRANVSNAPDAYDIYHSYSEDKVQQEALQTMAKKWDEMTKYQLDLLVEGGKITDEEKIAMRESHPHYVKSRRSSSNNDKSFEFLETGGAGGSKPKVRAGTIEYDPVVHVMQNTIAQAHSNAQAAQQNQAALYLYREVIGNAKHWEGWFTKEKEEIHHLDAFGFLHDRPTSRPEAFDIPVTIMSDDGKSGKTVYLRPVPQNQKAKLFAAGMNKLGVQNQGAVAKVLGFGNKIVRNMAVTFSPAFLAANIFRDPATALYNLQATEGKDYSKEFLLGKKPTDSLKADAKGKGRTGLGAAWRILNSVYTDRANADPQHIKWVEEWEHAGGRQSFTQALKEMDEGWKSFESSLAIARKPGISHAYKGLEWVEKYNIIVENISRFSAYSTVMEAWERGEISKWDTKEKAQREAAIISKELTTNFDRKGFSSQAIGLWHLFFNATVQGNVIVLRNLIKSKKLQKMVVGSVVTATMFDLLGRMSADDDDEGRNEWDNIPDYIKERNIILPFKIGGVYVKIPAPWVYNSVWRAGGMIGELAANKRDMASVPIDMGLSLLNTFNPMSSTSLMQSLSPTILDPFVQAVENKNFAGNPIKPTSFPGAAALPESQLYWNSTPKAYVGLAQTINALSRGDVAKSGFIDISPGVIHNYVNFFTAGVGKAIGQVYELGEMTVTDKEFEIKDVPILSTYAITPGSQVDVQLYHSRVAEILQAQKAVDLYGKGKTRDIEKQRESRIKYARELRLVNQVKDVERQLKSLRTRMQAAQGRKDSKRVKQLKARLTAVQQKFNKTYERRIN